MVALLAIPDSPSLDTTWAVPLPGAHEAVVEVVAVADKPSASTLPVPPRPSLQPSVEAAVFDKTVEDGWDDDISEVEDEVDAVDKSSSSTPVCTEEAKQSSPSTAGPRPTQPGDDWVYNPEDDIIPTRKRWINPRSGSRQLSSLMGQFA